MFRGRVRVFRVRVFRLFSVRVRVFRVVRVSVCSSVGRAVHQEQ